MQKYVKKKDMSINRLLNQALVYVIKNDIRV